MPDPYSWQFSQLSGAAGKPPRPPMILQGWQAPFGRPRRGAIVNAGISVRRQLTYYAGTNIPPTVHSFGTEPKPFELHGRWMDFAIGAPGGAQKARSDWRDFITDAQLVRAAWGAILSYKIFIHDLDLEFESSSELIWRMKADVIEDENAPANPQQVVRATPADLASQMQALLVPSLVFSTPRYFSLRGFLTDIADAMDSVVATINSPFTFIFNICSALSDFETAMTSDVGKLLGGLSMMRTGLLELRDVTDNLMSGSAVLDSTVDSQVLTDLQSPGALFPGDYVQQMTTDKAAADAANANMLALIADMRAQLLVVQRGQPKTAYVAQDGDSWESIAVRRLGSVDGADAIRDTNGAKYGERPVPGKRLSIPRSV